MKYKEFIKERFETNQDVFYHQLANFVIDEIKNAFDIHIRYFINENLFLILLKVPNANDIVRHMMRIFNDLGIDNYEIHDDGRDLTIEIISVPKSVLYDKNLFKTNEGSLFGKKDDDYVDKIIKKVEEDFDPKNIECDSNTEDVFIYHINDVDCVAVLGFQYTSNHIRLFKCGNRNMTGYLPLNVSFGKFAKLYRLLKKRYKLYKQQQQDLEKQKIMNKL